LRLNRPWRARARARACRADARAAIFLALFLPHSFQVEYAIKAIEQGSCALGVRTSAGVVLGVEKRLSSPLLEQVRLRDGAPPRSRGALD
jgi:hypothetical protein